MSVVLKIDTKPTLFQPNEIEIDGVRLQLKELTLGALEQVQELQKLMVKGSAKATREMLEQLVEGDTSVLLKLPVAKLAGLTKVLFEKVLTPDVEEKNGLRPGGESQPS